MNASKSKLRNRIVDFQVVDPKTLVPNEKNWRRHPDAQRAALNGALNELGWVGVVTVNRTTGNLVDGHLRRDAALERGEKGVPAIFVELSEQEEALMLASLDSIGALAVTDRDQLDALLGTIEVEDESLREFLLSLEAPVDDGLLDPSEGKDDSKDAEKLNRMRFGDYDIPMTDAEVVALGRLVDAYLEKNGSHYGFVSHVVRHVPA